MSARSFQSEAIVLRSIRYGEADRILHLFTPEHGRVNAIAKGARRARSRFGARLEPPSRVEVRLHRGRGSLATVTGVDLIASNDAVRRDHRRAAVATVGIEAVLQLFAESDPSAKAFEALARFLDVLGEYEPASSGPATDPLALSFQFKLLWLAGFAPHLDGCTSCGEIGPLSAFSAAAGGAVCEECRDAAAVSVSGEALGGVRALLEAPLSEAAAVAPEGDAAREMLWVLQEIQAYHGGFRLKTLAG